MSDLPPTPSFPEPPGGVGEGPPPPPGSVERAPPAEEPAPPQKRSSRWPVVLAVVLVLFVIGGAVALYSWATGGPSSCGDGDFTSARFGYCTAIPSGWDVVAPNGDDAATADRFQQPAASGTIEVTAVPLSGGQDLDQFTTYVRQLDEEAGWVVGRSTPTQVADIDAVTFDIEAGTDAATRSREVVFVRDGFAWRVQLADGASSFDASTRALDQLLGAWVFL
jgi:hypothetical protein